MLFAPFVGFSQQQSASGGHLSVSLTEDGSQGYPATNIHPNICLNAQSEYETTKFAVTINPADASASLEKISGDVSLDKTSVSDGDTVTITGNATGNYEIKATHSEDSSVTDTANGTVFEFKFADLTVDNSSSDIQGNASLQENKLTASTNTSGEYAGGYTQKSFKLKVTTDPADAFTGDVKAGAKIEQKYSYSVRLRKGRDADGVSTSVSISAGVFSYSWGSNGSEACCGYGLDRWVKPHGGDWSKSNILDVDTDAITFLTFDIRLFQTRKWSNSDLRAVTEDEDRTYTIPTTEFDFEIRYGGVTKSSDVVTGFGGGGATSSNDSNIEAELSSFDVEDKDDTYEIQ
jgi:hypothetical protein